MYQQAVRQSWGGLPEGWTFYAASRLGTVCKMTVSGSIYLHTT